MNSILNSDRLVRYVVALVAAFGLAMLSGCEGPPAKPASNQPQANEPSSSGSSVVPMPSKGTTAWGPALPDTSPPPASPAAKPATPPPAAPAPAAASSPAPGTTEKKAGVGSGKKGRGYGKGVVATPAASIWAVRERLVFEVQIPQAMSLFKATEGRGPKDHNEFMAQIIKANNIHLPQLPEGDVYRYDPKTEQLMIDSPVRE
jgi:hypothetical protein